LPELEVLYFSDRFFLIVFPVSLPFAHLNGCQAYFIWPKHQTRSRAYKDPKCFEDLLRFVSQNNPHFHKFPTQIRTPYVFSAQFAVHKSRIRQNPISYYKHLYDMVMDGCECETIRGCDQCIHFEALWSALFLSLYFIIKLHGTQVDGIW
jgi:hypothetical protein